MLLQACEHMSEGFEQHKCAWACVNTVQPQCDWPIAAVTSAMHHVFAPQKMK